MSAGSRRPGLFFNGEKPRLPHENRGPIRIPVTLSAILPSALLPLAMLLFAMPPNADLCAASPANGTRPMPDIGPTLIPFYTGNLSVDTIMAYWGTRKEPPAPQVTPESIAQLRRTSCFAACDYLTWATIEREPGRWDFSLHQDNAAKLRDAGIEYNVFCWLHFPPKWFLERAEFVPYRCLEHDRPVAQMSLWSPTTRRIYREFYARLANALGKEISFLRLAMPSEYGEIGYPVGMTNWIVPQEHVHPGYWCGDPHARASFRSFAMRRYRTLERLNEAWDTSFSSREAIDYPPIAAEWVAGCRRPDRTRDRVRWLDFQEWYHRSWADFMTWSAAVVRGEFPAFSRSGKASADFPRREIIASLGYGSEDPAFGNDQGLHVAAMKKAGLVAQTPGDIGYLATRRVSSACAFHGVPYITEPPGDVSRDREVQRIWMDASNGSRVFFDYPQNLDGARDLLKRYKEHLTGRRSIADIGLLLPTTTHRLHPEWRWPPALEQFAETARDRFDYEVLDERMIAGGGLDRLRIGLLVVADAEYLEAKVLRSIAAWVRRGGFLVSFQPGPVRRTDGSEDIWRTLLPETRSSDAPASEADPTAAHLWKEWGRRAGRGGAMALPGGPERVRWQAEAVAELSESRKSFLPGSRNSRRVDDGFDGVPASLFKDRILYFNPGDRAVEKVVVLRESDFEGDSGTGRPERWEHRLEIKPHGIASILLR